MTTKVQAVKRSLVSLKLERPTPKLITQATALVPSMTSNPNFTTPNPPQLATDAIRASASAATARCSGPLALEFPHRSGRQDPSDPGRQAQTQVNDAGNYGQDDPVEREVV